jgi:alpha-beta hydrolase superfamily lysophospholipase
MRKLIDNITFQIKPSTEIPDLRELHYREINLIHEKRRVRAWIAERNDFSANKSAVILFNGIGGTITDWFYIQKYMSENGITSVSFDYGPQSDISKKKGTSRLSDVTHDINAIIDTLIKIYGDTLNLFLLGHSVGNAVMLEMYSQIDTSHLRGIIICNSFSSLKNWNIQHHYLPKAFAFLFPDYFSNTSNIKKVYKPVLVMHSKSDSVNLFSDGEKVFNSANEPKEFVEFDSFGHNDLDKKGNFIYWSPIVKFIRNKSKK